MRLALIVALSAGCPLVAAASTGDAAADTCVRSKLVDVVIKSAPPTDKLELEVTLEPATQERRGGYQALSARASITVRAPMMPAAGIVKIHA